jgi:hypothetical protein
MNKKDLSERDICSKFIGPAVKRAGWDGMMHLAGLVDAKVTVTLEIQAEIPSGAPENVVRTVTENCRTLKFDTQGFEDA